MPVEFEEVDYWHFRYNDDDVLGIEDGYDVRPIPDNALVCEQRGIMHMLPVLRDWILADFGIEAWSSFLENIGEPFLLGRYPPGVDDDFKDEVQDAVDSVARSARGIAPEGTDIEHIESSRSSADHQAYREDAKKGISVALLGHENAMSDEGGVNVGGQDGSMQVRDDIALGDIRFIEPIVQRFVDLVVSKNFADGQAPTFALEKPETIDRQQLMDALNMAWRMGAPVSGSDLRKLGIDVPPDETYQRDTSSPIDHLMRE